MKIAELLEAPCIFCEYNGEGYYQPNTHSSYCPWSLIGGIDDRINYFVKAAKEGWIYIYPDHPETGADYMRLYIKALKELIDRE